MRPFAARWAWAPLAVLMAIAFALRLVPVVIHPSLNWGDEVFQATEQAHRLVYGRGLVPWEFQLGMRSWLLPGVIAGVMQAARVAAPGPAVYLPAIAAVFGVLAVAPVACAFLWARRRGAGVGAWAAALVVATAPELVYFGDRTLAEVVAAHVMLLGLYALLPGFAVVRLRRLAAGGALIGLGVALRLQIAPAAAIMLVAAVPGQAPVRRGMWIAAGLAFALAAAGAIDAVTLGSPFASIWRYVQFNVLDGASATFGVHPWFYYGIAEISIWGGLIAAPLALCWLGLRVWALPVVCAAALIAAHMLIGHKEHRFIYPALLLLAVQAGFGLSVAVDWLARRWQCNGVAGGRGVAAAHVVLCGAWCLVALAVWQGESMRVLRNRVHDPLLAAAYVSQLHGVCGIALSGFGDASWAAYGGYTHLHQPVRLYWPDGGAADTAAFNVMLAPRTPAPQSAFAVDRCFGEICVFRRAGGCADIDMRVLPMPGPVAAALGGNINRR